MKKIVFRYAVVFSLVIISGGMLMNISQHVQRAEREIKSYDKKISVSEEEIRVLNAEWAYLNNPQRLDNLASKGVYLTSPKSLDLISDLYNPRYNDAQVNIPSYSRYFLYRDISYVPDSRAVSPKYDISTLSSNINNGGAQ